MQAMKRSAILKMAADAYELRLHVSSGKAIRDENGHWKIGHHVLEDWLTDHEGEELVLIMGSLEDEETVETRTCYTCGRDYTGHECPHCRANRIRLRGEP